MNWHTNSDVHGPALRLGCLTKLWDGMGKVRCERTIDMRLQLYNIYISTSYKHYIHHCNYYRVGQKKPGPVWALITQRWLAVERRVIRQKFQNAVRNKRQICIVKHLNILCLIYINICHPRNSAKFDCNTWIWQGYLSFYNLVMFIDGKACNTPNVSKLCTEEVYNLHVSLFKYSLPDLHKSVPPLKLC